MNVEDVIKYSNFRQTSEFLTAKDLVALRKPKLEPSNPGPKYTSPGSETLLERKALECALESHRNVLEQKRGSRICDSMQAEWNEELNMVITTKLKGKFVQHMGHTHEGKIVLSSEESLFLLENGCIEISNGKVPMSTEEAFVTILTGNLSFEKYQVYSHLSQLGFIVVPHQKELNKKEIKQDNPQKKRKIAPELQEPCNKRITFSGALLEECDVPTEDAVPITPSVSGGPAVESECQHEEIDVESICENSANSPTVNRKEPEDPSLKHEEPISNISEQVMDVDSLSTEISFGVTEKSRDVLEVERPMEMNPAATLQSQDSHCAIISSNGNVEDNSEVMSYSSDSQPIGEESNNSRSVYVDDEVTLLEVTKKENKPLAVIDLLSDEEAPPHQESGSDEDIKVIQEHNGTSEAEPQALNLSKIKPRKFYDYKRENNQIVQSPAPIVQYPLLYKKDIICVACPRCSLLPNHVRLTKEVYILDIVKISGTQPDPAHQQPGRMWNSYREMQDYQRSRRQNYLLDSPFNRFQNRDGRPWHRENPRLHDSIREHRREFRRDDHRHSFDRSPRDRLNDSDRNVSYHNSPRDYQGDFPDHVPSEDQKPLRLTNSPEVIESIQRNVSSSSTNSFQGLLQIPKFVSNSMPGRGNEPVYPFHVPQTIPHLAVPEIAAEVRRTALSYATSMLTSIFGHNFNPGTLPHFPPFQQERPFGMDGFNSIPNSSFGPSVPGNYALPNYRRCRDYRRSRRVHSGNPFPCQYRNVGSKRSWSDVKSAVTDGSSPHEENDIEEIPINLNEFLWGGSSMSPLIKPGIKHPYSEVFIHVKLIHMAAIMDRKPMNNRCFPDKPSLEIAFDVYLPGTNFKKSCPAVPKYRIVVVRACDPIPRLSEIAFLQKHWNDGALLNLAVVDNNDISFCSFNSINLPNIMTQEK